MYIYSFFREIQNHYKKRIMQYKTRKNAIVEYLDYQIPFTQLKGHKGIRYASRDLNIQNASSKARLNNKQS